MIGDRLTTFFGNHEKWPKIEEFFSKLRNLEWAHFSSEIGELLENRGSKSSHECIGI
jgi:hypothetical protein